MEQCLHNLRCPLIDTALSRCAQDSMLLKRAASSVHRNDSIQDHLGSITSNAIIQSGSCANILKSMARSGLDKSVSVIPNESANPFESSAFDDPVLVCCVPATIRLSCITDKIRIRSSGSRCDNTQALSSADTVCNRMAHFSMASIMALESRQQLSSPIPATA